MPNWLLYKFNDSKEITDVKVEHAVILIGNASSSSYFTSNKTMNGMIKCPSFSSPKNIEIDLTSDEAAYIEGKSGRIYADGTNFARTQETGFIIFEITRKATEKAGVRETTLTKEMITKLTFCRTAYDFVRYFNPSTAVQQICLLTFVPLIQSSTNNPEIIKTAEMLAEAVAFTISPTGYITEKALSVVASQVSGYVLKKIHCDNDELHDSVTMAMQTMASRSSPTVTQFVEPYVTIASNRMQDMLLNYLRPADAARDATITLASEPNIESELSTPTISPTTDIKPYVPPSISATDVICSAQDKAIKRGCKDHEEVIAEEACKILANNRWGEDESLWNRSLMEIWHKSIESAYARSRKHRYNAAVVAASPIILETQAIAKTEILYVDYRNNQPLTAEAKQVLSSIEVEQAIAVAFVNTTCDTIASYSGKPMTEDQTSQIHYGMLTVIKEVETAKQKEEIIDRTLPFLEAHCPDVSQETLKAIIVENIAIANNFGKGAWAGSSNFRELPRVDSKSHHFLKRVGEEFVKGAKRAKNEGGGVGYTTDGNQHTVSIGTARDPYSIPVYTTPKPHSSNQIEVKNVDKNIEIPLTGETVTNMDVESESHSKSTTSSPKPANTSPILLGNETKTLIFDPTLSEDQLAPPHLKNNLFFATLPVPSSTLNASVQPSFDKSSNAEAVAELTKLSANIQLKYGNKLVGIIENGISEFLSIHNYHTEAKSDPATNNPKTLTAINIGVDAAIDLIPFIGPLTNIANIIQIIVSKPEVPQIPSKEELIAESLWESQTRRELYQSAIDAHILYEVLTLPATIVQKMKDTIIAPLQPAPSKAVPSNMGIFSGPIPDKNASVVCTDRECFTFTKK